MKPYEMEATQADRYLPIGYLILVFNLLRSSLIPIYLIAACRIFLRILLSDGPSSMHLHKPLLNKYLQNRKQIQDKIHETNSLLNQRIKRFLFFSIGATEQMTNRQ